MNTDVQRPHDVQRTHKVVVGIGVALVAAAGISTVAVNMHRAVLARTASGSAPTVVPSEASMAQNQAPGSAPPPQAEGPTLSSAADATAAAEAPATQTAPQPVAVPRVTSQGSAVDGVRRSRNDTDNVSGQQAPTSEPGSRSPLSNQNRAVVSATPGASAAVGDESLFARNAAGNLEPASADTAARTSIAADSSSAGGAGPALSSAEVPSTVQARAAGGDAENSDRLITQAVESQIAASQAGGGTDLSVTTVNGIVILTGTAASSEVIDHVKRSVQSLKDVRGVDTTAVQISGS